MTTFKGHKTAFNRTGSNDTVPDMEAQTANFCGRGAVPSGKLKAPMGFTDIDDGNRRLAKSRVGGGGGGGGGNTSFNGTNAFTKGKRK